MTLLRVCRCGKLIPATRRRCLTCDRTDSARRNRKPTASQPPRSTRARVGADQTVHAEPSSSATNTPANSAAPPRPTLTTNPRSPPCSPAASTHSTLTTVARSAPAAPAARMPHERTPRGAGVASRNGSSLKPQASLRRRRFLRASTDPIISGSGRTVRSRARNASEPCRSTASARIRGCRRAWIHGAESATPRRTGRGGLVSEQPGQTLILARWSPKRRSVVGYRDGE